MCADSVIWFGDFNYRIGLDRPTTLNYIQRGDLATLYDNDQVSTSSQKAGNLREK